MTDSGQNLSSIIAGLDEDVRVMLREDLAAQRDTAIAAMDAGDWQRARDTVHAVNGSASFCRLHELRAAATALELELDSQRADPATRKTFLYAIDNILSVLN